MADPTNNVNPEFIERYQLLYQKDPNSKVFAPLAEAYRKMGLIDEAYRICEAGVERHPNFPSGRVAFAKILIEKKLHQDAITQLLAAVEFSPENILGHLLLGECYLQMKQMKEALKAYKMVMFLNPNDTRAFQTVKKLESLTADEYGEDVFAVRKIDGAHDDETQAVPKEKPSDSLTKTMNLDSLTQNRILERNLSLADAYIVRNDVDSALKTLDRARDQIGAHPELDKRKRMLVARQLAGVTVVPSAVPPALRKEEKNRRKVEKLHRLLDRIQERKVDTSLN
jgi:tetratricopeptide (TPR) repeat protein